ncbi:PREDICTED: store-operated calcium entry regulator STIMATE-like [Lepidothrix coronata]|uniref:Store-operated calcium entry regulator STIMATE-like n=1 Tax=Lepidothrix coronata TaxID=321398 RepID=A0A6J0GMK7_9PASS|nr:PREDICTED: store-operated calcium entry regulator STIMATE-like [Lepidothrix coronata]
MAAPRPAHGCGSGALLGRFGVLLQALLALCAFSTLMLKRFKEPKAERRPWRIWFYDTSKQAIGALFIHFANVFLSDLTEEDPCSLYLINFILDATLGMLLIWLGVKVVSWIVQNKKYTYLVFGEYDDVAGGCLHVAPSASFRHSGLVADGSKQPVVASSVELAPESEVLLSPDMDFDQSESDQDTSGLHGTNQKMKQPSYQVVI